MDWRPMAEILRRKISELPSIGYSADDMQVPVIHNGQTYRIRSVLLAAPPSPGAISGLQLRRYSDTQVLVRRGALEIGGQRYTLPNDAYVDAPTGAGFGWRYLAVRPPASGNTLTAPYCFSTWAPSLRPVHWGPGWIITENNYRVIGLYPGVGNAVAPFWTGGGKYLLSQTIIDATSMPAAATSTNVGLPPFPEPMSGQYDVTLGASGAGARVAASGSYAFGLAVGGATGVVAQGQLNVRTATGAVDLAVAPWTPAGGQAGAINWIRMILRAVDIPTGMAR